MNKKIKYLFCLFIACLAVVLGSLNAKADFGNFSGNSDYGGGRRRSSSSGRSYNRGNSYNSGRSYTYYSGNTYDDDDDDYTMWIYAVAFTIMVIACVRNTVLICPKRVQPVKLSKCRAILVSQ